MLHKQLCLFAMCHSPWQRWRKRKVFGKNLYCLFYSSIKIKNIKLFPLADTFTACWFFAACYCWDEKGDKHVLQGWHKQQQLFQPETNVRPQGGKQQRRDKSESEVTPEMWAWPDIQSYNAVISGISFPPLPSSHLFAFGLSDTLHQTTLSREQKAWKTFI